MISHKHYSLYNLYGHPELGMTRKKSKINMNISQCLHCKIKGSDNKFCSLKEKYEILI